MNSRKHEHYTRLMLSAAALILIVNAALHAMGYAPVASLLLTAGIAPAWAGGIKALWLIYAFHFLVIATILGCAASRAVQVPTAVLLLCGLICAVDSLVLLAFVGVFVGNLLLALAAALVFGAVARGVSPTQG